MLISNRGQLVEKSRIFDEIWDGVIVSDSALTQCIKSIRKQLKDDASHPRYIKTIPKHGYVFIGDVVEDTEDPPDLFDPTVQIARPYKFLDYYRGSSPRNVYFKMSSSIMAILLWTSSN